ncbi:hypothetical protein DE146DRAFT_179430 [Phaeosphaeria sp. MPI-PUGE-AT-0046c]|nr:hypothetical protein DE146DRAFT_179430 [Phaeosphaeria sp. MPI-PUGE-AT-0046c]
MRKIYFNEVSLPPPLLALSAERVGGPQYAVHSGLLLLELRQCFTNVACRPSASFLHAYFTKNDTGIIPAMPERWEQCLAFDGGLGPFSEPELCRILDRLRSDTSRRFFFLIDGLDEFEGKPSQILRFVFDTARFNVKLCVASRPWSAFEDAFEQRPSLLLQDLTRKDIFAYVASQFEDNNHFKQLQVYDHGAASALLQNVVVKASGVFLWVHVVVQSLLEGLQNSDRLSDLHSRLDALPGDLEALFNNLLDRLSSDYFRQACEILRLLYTFRSFLDGSGPTLLAMYHADDSDTKSSLDKTVKQFGRSFRLESIMTP